MDNYEERIKHYIYIYIYEIYIYIYYINNECLEYTIQHTCVHVSSCSLLSNVNLTSIYKFN